MEQFKEFTGKSLDDAIGEACSFYNAEREQLEIEIIQDAKSGIFGLVGARKAKIHARRVELRQAMEDLLGRKQQGDDLSAPTEAVEKASAPKSAAPQAKPAKEKAIKAPKSTTEKSEAKKDSDANANSDDSHKAESPKAESPKAESPKEKRERSAKQEKQKPKRQDEARAPKERKSKAKSSEESFNAQDSAVNMVDMDDMDDAETSHHIPFEELDKERMSALSLEAVNHLVRPIVGDVPMRVEFHENRVCVHLECGDDSGLLIGREGQTLSALQYIASRIVSRGMAAAVRVQLDAGDYRLRQDEKLRELALALADRVRHTGKSYSTRPLSSYHRRVVHMALQDASDILTRSSGEGPLKRVIVQKKR